MEIKNFHSYHKQCLWVLKFKIKTTTSTTVYSIMGQIRLTNVTEYLVGYFLGGGTCLSCNFFPKAYLFIYT